MTAPPFAPRTNLAELHERTAPFASKIADTAPEPFDWAAHDAMMDARMAELKAGLERWKATAEAFGRPVRQPDYAQIGIDYPEGRS